MLRSAWLVVVMLGLTCVSAFGQEDGQVYRIKSRLTDKVLSPNEDGTLLVQESGERKNEKQHWKLVKSDQHFLIVNVASGKAITSPSKEALAQVALEDHKPNDKPKVGQLWSIEPHSARFLIQSRRSDLYLDVYDFGKEDGVKIIQQTLNGKRGAGNQVWELIPVK